MVSWNDWDKGGRCFVVEVDVFMTEGKSAIHSYYIRLWFFA